MATSNMSFLNLRATTVKLGSSLVPSHTQGSKSIGISSFLNHSSSNLLCSSSKNSFKNYRRFSPVLATVEVESESPVERESVIETPKAAPRTTRRAPRTVTVNLRDLKPGQKHTGKVKSIVTFGCFVDIGSSIDGLVHISQLSKGYVDTVANIVSIGQDVDAWVIEADTNKGRLALTMRDLEAEKEIEASNLALQSTQNPNSESTSSQNGEAPNRRKIAGKGRKVSRDDQKPKHNFKKGQKVTGVVKSLVGFGCFVELSPGVEGLLHASEIQSGGENVDIDTLVEVGKEIEVTIIKVEKNRISLTAKESVNIEQVNLSLSGGVSDMGMNPFELAFRKANLIPEVPEPTPEPLAETTADPKPAAEAVSEPEPVVETVAEPEPSIQAVAEPIAETVAEPETIVEVVSQPEPVVEAVVEPEPIVEAVAEPEPTVEAVTEPEPIMEAAAKPEPTVEAVAEPEPVVELVAEPEPAVEAVAKPEPVVEPEPIVEAVAEPEPVVEAVAEPEPEPVVEAVAELEPEPVVEAVAEPESEPIVEAAAEPEPVAETTPETLAALASPEPVSDLPKQTSVISASSVKSLRDATGAGMMDCKKALAACDNDIEKATEFLRKKGLASAEKKASRVAAEGLIGSYIHDGRIGVLVEVNCETDFVSRGSSFKELVEDISMQIVASTQVNVVSLDDIPAELKEKEKAIEMQKEDLLSKPEAVREKIVEGRVAKRMNEFVLLEQPYIKNDKILVKDLVKQNVATIGENIQVRRFIKFNLGEGIEKKTGDFASEVAAAAAVSVSATPSPAAEPAVEEKKDDLPKVAVSASAVKSLRDVTGAGMIDCKKALAACDNDIEKATEFLRKKGLASADKKASRIAAEGLIGSYVHDGRFGVLVEINCETDFVSRGDTFKELVEDIAMQIVACPAVKYISVDDVDPLFIAKEKEIEMGKADLADKKEEIRARIVEGRVAKRVAELALLEQPFIKNDKILIKDLVKQTIANLGENVRIRRFERFNLGEGIEKKTVDFATEVAAAAGLVA